MAKKRKPRRREKVLLVKQPKGIRVSPAVELGTQDLIHQVDLENPHLQDALLFTAGVHSLPLAWNENQPPPALPQDVRELYHFTSHYHLPSILRYGIAKGDVPITPSGGYNSPWLTDDPHFLAQTWVHPSPPELNMDKAEVRLTVFIPTNDTSLWSWPTLAVHEKMDKVWFEALNAPVTRYGVGVDVHNHERWYVYQGRIPPEWVQEVTFKTHVNFGTCGHGKSGDMWPQ